MEFGLLIERRAEHRGTAEPPGLMVRVQDVDAHHERALTHRARILDPPTDFAYRERQYVAEDLGGHRWTFSQTIADVAREDWEAVPRAAL